MPSVSVPNRATRLSVVILCTFSLLLASFPRPAVSIAAESKNKSGKSAAVQSNRTRTNHNTKIKVSVPSSARVNTWGGDLIYSYPLLNIPGRGYPIDLSLNYSSLWNGVASRVGFGWQLDNGITYRRDDKGNISIVWGDRRTDTYVKSNGSFLSPMDVHFSLREFRPGQYLLKSKEGTEYYFTSPIHKSVTRIQDPNGNALSFSYDANFFITSMSEAGGRQVNFSYTNGLLTTITDPNTTPARSISLQYDTRGNLISVTNALGIRTRYEYDANHYLTRIIPAKGEPTNITWSGALVTRVSGDLITKSFSYDTVNRVTTITAPAPEGDQRTRFFYDAEERISAIEDHFGNRITVGWDESNNLIRFADALNRVTSYEYDERGNLMTITDAQGNKTKLTYDAVYSKLTSLTDAKNQKTTFDYDAKGNLIRETDPLGNATSYVYDSRGDLTSRTDANGKTTTYQYDARGNLTNTI